MERRFNNIFKGIFLHRWTTPPMSLRTPTTSFSRTEQKWDKTYFVCKFEKMEINFQIEKDYASNLRRLIKNYTPKKNNKEEETTQKAEFRWESEKKCWCWTWERWERNQVGDQLGRPPASPPASSRVYRSVVSSPRSNPLSDVRSYEQATSWFPPASSTLCTLASAAPRSSSWTPPRKSWRCDGQDAAGCPTLSRCTWQREQIIWCPDIFKWCHQHLNTLNWALICPTKDFPFSSNHGKIILCWVFIVLLTTVKFLAHLSTQWPSTTKCFHTTLTRASEPICANRFLKGGL